MLKTYELYLYGTSDLIVIGLDFEFLETLVCVH